jgi:hypothetical protein
MKSTLLATTKRCANCQNWGGSRTMLNGNKVLQYDTNDKALCYHWRTEKRADGYCTLHIILSIYK